MPSGAAPPPGPLTRVVGNIFRARMARLDVTLLDLTEVAAASVPQLSKMLRGRARMDIEQFDAICRRLGLHPEDVWREAKEDVETGTTGSAAFLSAAELRRRLVFLVDMLAAGNAEAAFLMFSARVSQAGRTFPQTDWHSLLSGAARRPPLGILDAIADGLGVDREYLRTDDPSLVREVEATVRFASVADASGLQNLSARGRLSPEALEAISELIDEKMHARQHGQGESRRDAGTEHT